MIDDKIPASWEKIAISEICSINPRLDKTQFSDDLKVTFVPMPAVEAETGKIDVSESKNFEKVKKGYTAFQQEDVLFAKITPCMENGKMAVVPALINDIGFGSTEFHVLRALAGILPKFIYYYVSSKKFRHDAEHNMTGAVGQRRVPTSYLEKSKVVVPPTKEQHRIVAKIEELFSEIDTGVESLEMAKTQLQVYRQALLKHAFEGKLTAQWRTDNPDKVVPAEQLLEQIKQAREERYQQQLADWRTAVEKWELGGKEGKKPSKPRLQTLNLANNPEFIKGKHLPSEWAWTTFESLLEYVTSGSRGWAKYYASSGSIFVRAQNLKYDTIDLEDVAFVDLPGNIEGTRSKLKSSDILITITGANVTKSGLVESKLNDAYISQHVALCRLLNSSWSEYVYFYILAETGGRKQLNDCAYGAGKPGLNLENIKSVTIPFCTYAEQLIILSELNKQLSVITSFESQIEQDLKRADSLRHSILKQAFSGQLVPQNPTDEPASKLLERIKAEKAEREAQAKANKTKKPRTRRKTKAATP